MKRAYSVLAAVVFLSVSLVVVSSGCGASADQSTKIDDSTEQLVKSVCSSCHGWVEPSMLDKATWRDWVIPVMASKMGIFEYNGQEINSEKDDPNLPPGIYPSKPMISMETLNKVFAYFEATAPDGLPLPQRPMPIGKATSRFISKSPGLPFTEEPLTTFLKILPDKKQIVVGVGGKSGRLGLFSSNLQPNWVFSTPSAPSWVETNGNNWLVTCIGNIFPSNAKEGVLQEMTVNGTAAPVGARTIADKLPRPIQVIRTDMNEDGSPDLLVNGFGHLAGKLYWMPQNNQKDEHVLRSMPGAIRTKILDWDGDGKKDVLTLFTQSREGVFLYRNKGKGQYEEKQLLDFLPVYGSSSFEIADVNADGKQDIIYTCGDNADYSVILKPYHGVYVYLNQGNDEFKESYFYPLHGCYSALARDFDLDGDLDMMTISFFADFLSQPEESIVYFENKGNMQFEPSTVAGFEKGRWLTIDAGDLDGDGDEDVVVGNFSLGPESFISKEMVGRISREQPFMLLENTTK